MRRCASALWMLQHDPMLRQRRDALGHVLKPHVLDWECRRCGRAVGSTTLGAQWGLLARLRRQSMANRYRLRKEA